MLTQRHNNTQPTQVSTVCAHGSEYMHVMYIVRWLCVKCMHAVYVHIQRVYIHGILLLAAAAAITTAQLHSSPIAAATATPTRCLS